MGISRIFLLNVLPLGNGGEYWRGDVGVWGDSTIVTRGLVGDCGWEHSGGGDKGISTIGEGVLVLVGVKSDCPEERNIPFRTGHGA